MKTNKLLITLILLFTIGYIVGAITIKYELFPYNIYKSQYIIDYNENLVEYHNKKDLIYKKFNSTTELIDSLRQGGYVLYMRHADKFENESSSQIRGALDSFESVTLNTYKHPSYEKGHALSEYGRVQAWILNKILIEELKIPIGNVISSPIKRCRETATIVSGAKPTTSKLLIYDGILKPFEVNNIISKQRELFSSSFSEKNNSLIVAHGFPVLQRIGINAKINQSDTLILKKISDKSFEVVEWFSINDWVSLLERKLNCD